LVRAGRRWIGGTRGKGAIPAIWVAGGGCTSHTGTRCRQFTGDMFGVTNSTCDDSLQRGCDRNAALGKVSIWDKAIAEHRRMKKRPEAIPKRAAGARLALTPARCGRRVGGARRGHFAWPAERPAARSDRVVRPPSRALAELVFAAVRPGFVTPCIVVAAECRSDWRAGPGGRTADRERRPWRPSARLRAASARRRRAPSAGARYVAAGPWPSGHPSCRRLQRNGQMEYFTLVKAGLRGGVRRSAAIAPRERGGTRDLVLTTLGSKPCVQSNIFGFVTT
jgi:hypothetical protein